MRELKVILWVLGGTIGFVLLAFLGLFVYLTVFVGPAPRTLTHDQLIEEYFYTPNSEHRWTNKDRSYYYSFKRQPDSLHNFTYYANEDEIGIFPAPSYDDISRYLEHDILCPMNDVIAFIPNVDNGRIGTFSYIEYGGGQDDFDDLKLAEIDKLLSAVINENLNYYKNLEWKEWTTETGISTHWNHDLTPIPPGYGIEKGFTWTFEQHHLRYGVPDIITYRRGIIILGKEDSAIASSARRAFPDDETAGPLSIEETLHHLRYKEGYRYSNRTEEDIEAAKAVKVGLNLYVLRVTMCNTRPAIRKKLGLRLGNYDPWLDHELRRDADD